MRRAARAKYQPADRAAAPDVSAAALPARGRGGFSRWLAGAGAVVGARLGPRARRMRDVTPEPEEMKSPDAAAGSAKAGPAQAEPAHPPPASGSGGEASSDDPAESAVRACRRLFGIRDRKPPAAETGRRPGTARRSKRQRANGGRERQQAGDKNGPTRDAETPARMPRRRSCRRYAARAGVYDESEAGRPARDRCARVCPRSERARTKPRPQGMLPTATIQKRMRAAGCVARWSPGGDGSGCEARPWRAVTSAFRRLNRGAFVRKPRCS